jgi:outer membrane protein TolC
MYLHNIKKLKNFFPFLLVLLFALGSCKVLQPYKHPETGSEKTLLRDQSVNDGTTIASIPWKNIFSDKNLQSLIEEAIKNNLDLQIAVARMKKAEAGLKQSKVTFLDRKSVV